MGTSSCFSVYTLILDNDLPTWSLKWNKPHRYVFPLYICYGSEASFSAVPIVRIQFSPSLTYIALTSSVSPPSSFDIKPNALCDAQKDNLVRIHTTTTGFLLQLIPHPRPVTNFTWRRSQASSRCGSYIFSLYCSHTNTS